jgi:hypothetical protein
MRGLADYARNNNCLEETLSFSWWRSVQTWATTNILMSLLLPLIFFVMALIVFVVFLILGISRGNLGDMLLNLGFLMGMFFLTTLGLGTLIAPVFLLMLWIAKPRSIVARCGELWFFRTPWKLNSIKWSHGSTKADIYECLSWPRRQCILVYPYTKSKKYRGTAYACGFSEEMRERWVALFKLAGVQELQNDRATTTLD